MRLVRHEAILLDVDERPERFGREAGSRRPQVIALGCVLLLGVVGIAAWAARSGSAPIKQVPVIVARAAPVPTPAPPPLAAAPVMAPAAPAPAAPAVALPRPESVAPALMAKATVSAPSKPASARIRPIQASSARRSARVIPAMPGISPTPAAATETVPTAKSEPASEPPARPAVEPALPTAPSSVADLVREAQHAWMAGHYVAAISKAQSALKAEPNPAQAVQAYELIATCACAIGKADAAREAASHLGDSKRELVKATCGKNGVTIE